MTLRSDSTEGFESAEKAGSHKVLLDDVKKEWGLLWHNRINDKVRAEGIANRDYSLLFVERGTVIIATRDFKALDLKEILRLHMIQNVERIVPSNPSVGGWRKFARTVLSKQRRIRDWKGPVPRRNHRKNLQLRKSGRGWLHYRMKK